MGRGGSRISVHRSKASDYKAVAESFFNGAEVASAFGYWNAAAILQVHTAIALADALTIKLGGVRCRGEDHYEVITLLNEFAIPDPKKKKAFDQLRDIINHKNWIAYSGQIFQRRYIDKLAKLLERFRAWALAILEN